MLLILPSSNAKVKICFSYIFHVKTVEVVLNNQMQICADEPETEDLICFFFESLFFGDVIIQIFAFEGKDTGKKNQQITFTKNYR